MGSDSLTPKTIEREYKPRSNMCTLALHHTDSKDPDIHDLDG